MKEERAQYEDAEVSEATPGNTKPVGEEAKPVRQDGVSLWGVPMRGNRKTQRSKDR